MKEVNENRVEATCCDHKKWSIKLKNMDGAIDHEKTWSNELQEQTREYFRSLPIAAMKHIGNIYGICISNDDEYSIEDRESGQVYTFKCIDDLIRAGWAID